MDIGKLSKRVTIQQNGSTQDANGEIVVGWSTFATVWASIVDVTGREFIAAGSTINAAQTKISIRYKSGVIPSMRVLHGSTVYRIDSVLGQDGKSLLLMCERVT